VQETTTLLSIIRTRGQRGLPLKNVYRMLYNKNLYLTAYGKLYRNDGAMTKGATLETVDGMSVAKIDHIINLLRHERYRWTPVRRVHIPKASGKTRALGIPPWSDKLLQEVIRLILEAFYEPQFDYRSHGFRPGRGCHTALTEIQRIWTGTRWFIEGDIAQYFDSIDHDKLIQLLGKRIHDNRFLQLIRRLLQAGYLEHWQFHKTLSGAPQGGVVSPILSNIYLHEFDRYVTGTLIPLYTRGEQRRTDPSYQRICNRLCYIKGKASHAEEAHALIKLRRTRSSKDPRDPDYRRLWYVRYADDVLLGYIGTRHEAEEIKQHLKTWLNDNLHLTLSDTKTLITHATTTPARFLGYEIVNQQSPTKCTNGIRSVNGRIALRVPQDVIEKKCRPYLRNGKPIHRPERIFNSDYSIVADYQQEYRGIVQYYQLAINVCYLGKLRWVMEGSLLKTLAAKHRSSVAKMAAKYRATTVGEDGVSRHCLAVTIEREGRPPRVARFGGIPLKRQRRAILDDQPPPARAYYTELEKRVRALECEICGATEQIEVHHIRKLNEHRRNDGRKVPAWKQQMIARQRKTLVLCRACHVKLHSGQFDDNLGMRR
jgi:group II intron reverse transcriptase/maturase